MGCSEREAWLELARLWRNCKVWPEGDACVNFNGIGCKGLCPCIDYLELPYSVENSMKKKIQDELMVKKRKTLAPFTQDGARKRIEFCLTMAKGLK